MMPVAMPTSRNQSRPKKRLLRDQCSSATTVRIFKAGAHDFTNLVILPLERPILLRTQALRSQHVIDRLSHGAGQYRAAVESRLQQLFPHEISAIDMREQLFEFIDRH